MVSLTCVFQFGIYGVLIGTIAALLYRANDIIIYANKVVLNRSPWPTYRRWLINLAVFSVLVYIFTCIPMRVDTYFCLFSNAVWVSIITMVVFVCINSIMEPQARKVAAQYLSRMLQR